MSNINGIAQIGNSVYFMGSDNKKNPIIERKPRYGFVKIERKSVGFVVRAAANEQERYCREDNSYPYEGAVTTYAEASRLASKLMKELA